MAKYTLMLRESGRAFANLSPSEMQAIFARYGAWSDGLRKAGTLGPSEKLTDGAGRVIRRTNGKVMVTDGPFTEGKEVLGGFFTIEAVSYDDDVHPYSDLVLGRLDAVLLDNVLAERRRRR